jgi:hypothetical protein
LKALHRHNPDMIIHSHIELGLEMGANDWNEVRSRAGIA